MCLGSAVPCYSSGQFMNHTGYIKKRDWMEAEREGGGGGKNPCLQTSKNSIPVASSAPYNGNYLDMIKTTVMIDSLQIQQNTKSLEM